MGYYVRLLTSSEKGVDFREIKEQVDSVKLVSGQDSAWEKIEISQPDGTLLAVLEKCPLSIDSRAEREIASLKESIRSASPANAREWLKKYLDEARVVYIFALQADNITPTGWPRLGRVQNLLKDSLGGIIQADKEGFYNEAGDYILWQMYEEATGTIPAAALNENGEWISYQLRLNDPRSVDRFKQGLPPEKGLLDRLLRR